MLELRPNCEHCNKDLPNTSTEAMICSFEYTYCRDCAIKIFENVCPTCSGNFVERPIRPSKYKDKYPASSDRVFKPKDLEKQNYLERNSKIFFPKIDEYSIYLASRRIGYLLFKITRS